MMRYVRKYWIIQLAMLISSVAMGCYFKSVNVSVSIGLVLLISSFFKWWNYMSAKDYLECWNGE